MFSLVSVFFIKVKGLRWKKRCNASRFCAKMLACIKMRSVGGVSAYKIAGALKSVRAFLVHIFACAYNNSARAVFRLFFCVSLCFCVLKALRALKI